MNYEKNLEFVKYYQENVLEDLKPIILKLNEEKITYDVPIEIHYDVIDPETDKIIEKCIERRIRREVTQKYNINQLFEIFQQHTNKDEYDKFCEILKIGWTCIFMWCVEYRYRKNYFVEKLELKYEQYFRDQKRHERNLKRIKIVKNENPLK